MVYIYYMKKISFGFLSLCFCFLFSSLFAQVTVVRVKGNKIFMDTSSAPAVHKGDTFKVILSAEKLTNPKNGKELGVIYNYSPEGKIDEVHPLYAVGELTEKAHITEGQEVVIESAAQTAAGQAATDQASAPSTHAITRYNPIEQEIISVTEGNFAGHPASFVTLSATGEVTVWQRGENKNLKEVSVFSLPTGKKGITLSAVDVKGTGSDQIFVVTYDPTRQTFTTLALEEKGGKLTQTQTLPYFVKELGCGSQKTLWAQRPFIMSDRPGNAKNVIYENNTFKMGKESFTTQHNWLSGLNYYPMQKADFKNLIYTSSTGKIRMLLENGRTTESAGDFGSTPNRISHKHEFVRFVPSLQAFGPAGSAQLVAVENISKLGILSETFGQYDSGKIHWLAYDQGRLKTIETTQLDGVLYDTACTDSAILTAEVLNGGVSTIVELSK